MSIPFDSGATANCFSGGECEGYCVMFLQYSDWELYPWGLEGFNETVGAQHNVNAPYRNVDAS